MAEPRRKDDRLFVRDGRRNYRRLYSRAEVGWGAAVMVALIALLVWVAWKGAHPDPTLFGSGTIGESADIVVRDGDAPSTGDRMPGDAGADGRRAQGDAGAGDGGSAEAAGAVAVTARAPFPAVIALSGWREGAIARYDSTNLYVKINGREDYYKSFGFRRLHWLSLASTADPAITVDIELFDMGTAANALGAYAGERPPEIAPELQASGMWHRARNAAFATVGRYYARIVGADESPAVLAQVEQVRVALSAALPGDPLPWGYTLFAGGMEIDPGRVAYVTENAFSLGFARQVYTAKLDENDLELFVVATTNAAAAGSLAPRFVAGFAEYGEAAGRAQNLDWVQDRNLHTFATATAHGAWVLGVRGAADAARGAAAVARGRKALDALPKATAQRAQAEAAAAPQESTPPTADAGAEPQS